MQAYAEPIIKSYSSLNQDNISKKWASTGIQGRSVGSVIFRSRFGCLDFRFRHIRCDLFVAFTFVVSVTDVIVVFGDVVDGWLRFWLSFLLFLAITAPTYTVAFVAPSTSLKKSFTNTNKQQQHPSLSSSQHKITSTTLSERQWNFNNGRSPFGLKKNAEIWNAEL